MAKKPNSLRFLEAQGIPYVEMPFPETVHSAKGVADHFGLPASQVYKTLVVLTSKDKPMLVMLAGDRAIALKRLAQAVGEKKLRMATQREAEACTGLKVGGISALTLSQRGFPVYIDQAAERLETVLVSAGQRGMNVRLKVDDLIHATGANMVVATAREVEDESDTALHGK